MPYECAPNEDLNQYTRQRSMIRVFVVRVKNLCTLLSKLRSVKIPISLRECAGYCESLRDAHVGRYVSDVAASNSNF